VCTCIVDYANVLAQTSVPAPDRCTQAMRRGWGGTGRMPEITESRGRSHRGATCFGRGTGILGVDLPTSDLLSRRGKYTRVYTRVYPRVYNSVHACTQLRSKYVRSRAPVAMSLGALTYGRCGRYGWAPLGTGLRVRRVWGWSVLLNAGIRRPSWRGACFAGDRDYSFLCGVARGGW